MGRLWRQWARTVAGSAKKTGSSLSSGKRGRPLCVSGVGSGSQHCWCGCHLPVVLKTVGGEKRTGVTHAPPVADSDFPGPMVSQALKTRRAVLGVNASALYFSGPGNYSSETSLSAGTDVIQRRQCCGRDAPISPVPQQSLELHIERAAPTQPPRVAAPRREDTPPAPLHYRRARYSRQIVGLGLAAEAPSSQLRVALVATKRAQASHGICKTLCGWVTQSFSELKPTDEIKGWGLLLAEVSPLILATAVNDFESWRSERVKLVANLWGLFSQV